MEMPICLPDAPCHVRRERSTADASSAAQTSSACCVVRGRCRGTTDHGPGRRERSRHTTQPVDWRDHVSHTRRVKPGDVPVWRPRPRPPRPGGAAPAAARWRGARQAQGRVGSRGGVGSLGRVGSRGGSRGPAARDETRERDQTQTRARSSAERPRARPGASSRAAHGSRHERAKDLPFC